MKKKLLTLPIGVQSFDKLRGGNYVYVDKTARLVELIEGTPWCFLSRPRRFGKSLTLSTLEAMFSGKAELFEGLAAESWAREQAKKPVPVLRFDMSGLGGYSSPEELNRLLASRLREFASDHDLALTDETNCGELLRQLIRAFFKTGGPVVVLIDEYDKPILDNLGDMEKADAMRQVLRSFYTVLKSCDEYLRFVMLTGISKFSKTGVFSAMNNLQDISMHRKYGDIAGYTQRELEKDFDGWIHDSMEALSLSREELLDKIRDYYDGFCFDGTTRLYNPFSILNFFSEREFMNYWYDSGSPSFIVEYMRRHKIKDPERYRGVIVKSNFTSSQEIERAAPESFLYQAGYLTIVERKEQELTLDYPNREVRDSISSMYLEHVYHVESYGALGSDIWRALKDRDISKVVELYNIALAGIPYEDYADQGESWYRSLFLMLLRGAGVTANGEIHTNRGRPDVVALFPEQVIVLEFKYAKESVNVSRKRQEGEQQIAEKNYAKPYEAEGRKITARVIIIDGEKREAVL
ncbi:MAG: AAA family ATPase [Synergistaceae bacterium]|nr:AAA family ATPase [Synergistaceae bacterium]